MKVADLLPQDRIQHASLRLARAVRNRARLSLQAITGRRGSTAALDGSSRLDGRSRTLHSAVGTAALVEGKECIVTAPGQVGFALFGPYHTLAPGRYVVTFGISFRETKATVPGDTVCCTVDVSVDRGNVLASQPVSVSMLGDPRDILAVPFELPTVSVVEYRVYVHGNAELVIDCDRPVLRQAANGGINLPRPLKITDSDNPVFRCCFEQFLDYHNKGAAIEPIGDGTIMEYLGLRLKIRNREDFQILWEVLLRNTYNFCTSKEVCVVDIGMNAGFASLFFSRMSHVKLVYAFEPFRVPFNRALENFALNAELQPKIKAYNFGLGAATQELSVLYDENNTLSGSVLGRDFGVDTKISIRDASDVLRRIVHEVKPLGLDIVIKMDCEGSEFPIFETLDLHGLLPEVQMFMIEWHKWWSPGRTQQELISRLLANGFNVFDHTDLFDPYAGALYAVRSSLPAPTEMTA